MQTNMLEINKKKRAIRMTCSKLAVTKSIRYRLSSAFIVNFD